ncbi:hypothetical protein IFO70_16900 [Phormidium tenue FACHB-886]|nr:hypothetical protein [Phormidium tenue FACHB-886]
MESGSRVSEPGERTPQPLANFIGAFVALLTLAVPIMSIAHFSSVDSAVWQPSTEVFSQQE